MSNSEGNAMASVVLFNRLEDVRVGRWYSFLELIGLNSAFEAWFVGSENVKAFLSSSRRLEGGRIGCLGTLGVLDSLVSLLWGNV